MEKKKNKYENDKQKQKKKRRKRIDTPHYFCCCWHNTLTTSILFNGCLYPTLPHCIIRQSEAAFIFFPQSRSRRVKTRYQYQIIIIIIIMHSIYLYSAYPQYTPCSKRFTLSPGAQHTSNTKGHLGDFYNICRQGQCCSSPGGPPSLTSASDRTGKFVWNTFPKGIPSKCLLQILGLGDLVTKSIEPSKLQLNQWRHWVVCVKCLTQGHNVWPEKTNKLVTRLITVTHLITERAQWSLICASDETR